MVKLYIASDHAGFQYKDRLVKNFRSAGGQAIEWVDLGTHSGDSVDYPDNANTLALRLLKDKTPGELLEPCGVLICGSGIGVCIAANRHKGIRAVHALEPRVIEMGRRHNGANVVCCGERLMDYDQLVKVVETFLATPYEGHSNDRHARRVRLMDR